MAALVRGDGAGRLALACALTALPQPLPALPLPLKAQALPAMAPMPQSSPCRNINGIMGRAGGVMLINDSDVAGFVWFVVEMKLGHFFLHTSCTRFYVILY